MLRLLVSDLTTPVHMITMFKIN